MAFLLNKLGIGIEQTISTIVGIMSVDGFTLL
jgi:hypothetical protein